MKLFATYVQLGATLTAHIIFSSQVLEIHFPKELANTIFLKPKSFRIGSNIILKFSDHFTCWLLEHILIC